MARTSNFADVIRKELNRNASLAEAVEDEAFRINASQEIYEARVGAGLTQTELADRIGSQQSVIARLEDTDYTSHSLTTLRKIGDALNLRLRVRYEPRYTPVGASVSRTEARWSHLEEHATWEKVTTEWGAVKVVQSSAGPELV